MIDDLEYRIAKLTLAPSDVIVIKIDGELTVEQVDSLKKSLDSLRPIISNKVIVLTHGIELSVLAAETDT